MSVVALNNFQSHSISMLITECSSYGGCLHIYTYGLCCYPVSSSYHKLLTSRTVSEYSQKGCERKHLWTNIRNYPDICLEVLQKTNNLSQDSKIHNSLFSMQYVPMLYNKDKLDKQVNLQSVGGWNQQLATWNYTVNSRYKAMTSE